MPQHAQRSGPQQVARIALFHALTIPENLSAQRFQHRPHVGCEGDLVAKDQRAVHPPGCHGVDGLATPAGVGRSDDLEGGGNPFDAREEFGIGHAGAR
ncbi:MAG: hypothetical protein R3D60_00125 [Paracoccaceae bacterium]